MMWNWLTILILVNATVFVAFAALWLWRRRSREVEHSISGAVKIPTYTDTLPQIEAEISRARRFHHRLSVVVFKLGNLHASREKPQERQVDELRFLFLGSLLRDQARVYDVVTFDPTRDQYILILVESNHRQAEGFVRRISRIVSERTGLSLVAGVAEFPYAGLIIQDLVSKAIENSEVTDVPSLVRRNSAAAV